MNDQTESDKIVNFPGAAAAAPVAPAAEAAPPAVSEPVAGPVLVTAEQERAARPGYPDCAIGYIHRPEVTGNFNVSLLSLVAADLTLEKPVFAARVLDHLAPPYLNLARNALIAHLLEAFPAEQAQVFLLLDADHKFRADQAHQLVRLVHDVERPVVSALYFSWDPDKYLAKPVLLKEGKTIWNYPASDLVEVDSCGMGFTAISRKWCEDWKAAHGPTWFDFRGTGAAGAGFAIEDRAFCERVRSTGGKIYVHTGIKIGHDKLVEVNETLYAAISLLRQRSRQPVKTPNGAKEGRN